MTPPIRMVSVPVEPTEAMIDFAAFHMVGGGAFTTEDRRSVIASVYRAMLTAAPVREEGGALLADALREMLALVLIKYGNLDADVNAAVERAQAALATLQQEGRDR